MDGTLAAETKRAAAARRRSQKEEADKERFRRIADACSRDPNRPTAADRRNAVLERIKARANASA